MSEAEQQFVNTSQRVRKEFEAKLEEVRRAGEEDVHLRMDAGTKRIMQQNRSLQEELRIHIEVCTVLLSASCCLRLPSMQTGTVGEQLGNGRREPHSSLLSSSLCTWRSALSLITGLGCTSFQSPSVCVSALSPAASGTPCTYPKVIFLHVRPACSLLWALCLMLYPSKAAWHAIHPCTH